MSSEGTNQKVEQEEEVSERLQRIVSTDLGAPPGSLCPQGLYHVGIEKWVSHYLSVHRSEIGIEDPWSLLVEVVCPSSFFSLSSHAREHEAQIEWDSEVWFARISLCCNLPFDLRQWVIIHELYELKHWRTGDAFHSLVSLLPPSELRDLVVHQFYQARNQEIEQEVGQYLGQRRPNHITTSPHPQSDMKKREEDIVLDITLTEEDIPTPPQSQSDVNFVPKFSEKKRDELVKHLQAWSEEDIADAYAAEVKHQAFLAQLREEEPNIITLTEEEMENIRL